MKLLKELLLEVNISFYDGKWTGKTYIDKEGVVHIPSFGFSKPPGQFEDIAKDIIHKEFSPKYEGYFRFTNNPKEFDLVTNGEMMVSKNHSGGFSEKGLSVSDNPSYGMQGYKYGYRVDGDIIGYGSDGEPLLDIKSLKPIKDSWDTSLNIIKRDRRLQKEILLKHGLPSDYFNKINFLNDPISFKNNS